MLVGLATQLLNADDTNEVGHPTTDKLAGNATETLLQGHGFNRRMEYRYVSEEYLETISADEF